MSSELPIGTLIDAPAGADDTARLKTAKLNRHTFWCGQSGSGKTYALGVLLEQVLLHTKLPIVVLDPNSDFVGLGRVREEADVVLAEELHSRDIRVLSPSPELGDPLKLRFVDMDLRSRAAVQRLDPVTDAEEYNVMLRLPTEQVTALTVPIVQWLRSNDDPAYQSIATRLENLGIADWDLWAWGDRDVNDVIDERPDATVVDLGHFGSAAEAQTTALGILDQLWAHRSDRIGRMIVVDEAHNLCPPDPATPLERMLTQRIVQIAAEGRKYGLWLLLSTQRPSKVHPHVLSQCDNLALMKTGSAADLDELARVFGYAPPELIARAPGFTQGQALFAGGFIREPSLVQLSGRLTHEGGTDVEVPLR